MAGSRYPPLAIPKHGGFIAYSAKRTITFLDTLTPTQLGLIQHPRAIGSIAISPDDRFLAIGGNIGKITIESLSSVAVGSVYYLITAYLNNHTAKIRWHTLLGIY